MYELVNVLGNTYYIQSPAKIGLYKVSDSEVVLIDSGNDKDAGRKIRQILDANKWKLTAIYTTHSNADHIGGCNYLQKQTGCKIYAPGIECDFTRHPILEPSFLYGGFPPSELRHKFTLAQECDALPLTENVLPKGFEIISLPGHFFDMVGYRTPDDVLFLADSLSNALTLAKYKIGFLHDVKGYLDTLEKIKGMKARIFVPSHADACEDIIPLADLNIQNTVEVSQKIIELCSEPKCFEIILKELFDCYNLTLNFEQYVLVGSTVKSYLTWLKESGKLVVEFSDNMLLWKSL